MSSYDQIWKYAYFTQGEEEEVKAIFNEIQTEIFVSTWSFKTPLQQTLHTSCPFKLGNHTHCHEKGATVRELWCEYPQLLGYHAHCCERGKHVICSNIHMYIYQGVHTCAIVKGGMVCDLHEHLQLPGYYTQCHEWKHALRSLQTPTLSGYHMH